MRRGPLVALIAHPPDLEPVGMADQPGRHRPARLWPANSHSGSGIPGPADPEPPEGSLELGTGGVQLAATFEARAVPAPDGVRPPAAEPYGQVRTLRRVLLVGEPVGAVLHGLRGLVNAQPLVMGNCGERDEEPHAGIDRVEQLAPRAPALRRPLLEDADRVSVAVPEVLQVRLLQSGRVGDGDGALWHRPPGRDAGDGGRDAGLARVEWPADPAAADDATTADRPVETDVLRLEDRQAGDDQHDDDNRSSPGSA